MWWKDAVIYELYVDKFAGDFKGLADKLDYLKELGVTAVHILPHYPSPMVDDGYDVSDYKGVRAELGTMEDFDAFVKKAKALEIRIILDLVLNHASTRHPLFLEAAADKDSASGKMFLWSETGAEYPAARNVFSRAKPSNWVRSNPSGYYYFSTFYPEQADFNWMNPRVFDFFTDVMDFWVGKGVSGFRLDAAPYLVKKEGTDCMGVPESHEILKKLRAHIDAKYPGTALLAEVHDALPEMEKYFDEGAECHMIYNFYMNERLMLALARGDRSILAAAVLDSLAIPQNTAWAYFLRNHDDISLFGLSAEDSEAVKTFFDPEKKYRFENYLAMRLASMLKGDKEQLISAHNWLFSAPGSHVLYYGDEIGMENVAVGDGEDMRRAVRGTFDWARAEKDRKDPDSLFNAIKKIVAGRTTALPAAPETSLKQ